MTAEQEILTPEELAGRLKLPVSWVRDQTRSRTADPIPHKKFGMYVRFDWNDPTLQKWIQRRSK